MALCKIPFRVKWKWKYVRKVWGARLDSLVCCHGWDCLSEWLMMKWLRTNEIGNNKMNIQHISNKHWTLLYTVLVGRNRTRWIFLRLFQDVKREGKESDVESSSVWQLDFLPLYLFTFYFITRRRRRANKRQETRTYTKTTVCSCSTWFRPSHFHGPYNFLPSVCLMSTCTCISVCTHQTPDSTVASRIIKKLT